MPSSSSDTRKMFQVFAPVRGRTFSTEIGIDFTSWLPLGDAPVKRSSCAPADVSSGICTEPEATPDAFAVSVPKRTGVDSRSTVTVLPGANPPQDTVTVLPVSGVVSLTVQVGAAVVLELVLGLDEEVEGLVEVVDPGGRVAGGSVDSVDEVLAGVVLVVVAPAAVVLVVAPDVVDVVVAAAVVLVVVAPAVVLVVVPPPMVVVVDEVLELVELLVDDVVPPPMVVVVVDEVLEVVGAEVEEVLARKYVNVSIWPATSAALTSAGDRVGGLWSKQRTFTG
jgi:hypothetical protein